MKLIVTGTGTDVGKTVVACGLARALAAHGPTKGIKPYETGVGDVAQDASALELAAGTPCAESYFRAPEPMAPAALEGVPTLDLMVERIGRELEDCDHAIVESAGGLFVPLGDDHTFADLAKRLSLPIVMVTYDALGTLSHTLATLEAAKARGLDIRATVLNGVSTELDGTQASNARLLQSHSDVPLVSTPFTQDGVLSPSLASTILDLVGTYRV